MKWHNYSIYQEGRTVTIKTNGKTVEIVTKKPLDGFDIARCVMIASCLVADQLKLDPKEPVWDSYEENYACLADLTMLVAHFYYFHV
jgi:hypothetical protein